MYLISLLNLLFTSLFFLTDKFICPPNGIPMIETSQQQQRQMELLLGRASDDMAAYRGDRQLTVLGEGDEDVASHESKECDDSSFEEGEHGIDSSANNLKSYLKQAARGEEFLKTSSKVSTSLGILSDIEETCVITYIKSSVIPDFQRSRYYARFLEQIFPHQVETVQKKEKRQSLTRLASKKLGLSGRKRRHSSHGVIPAQQIRQSINLSARGGIKRDTISPEDAPPAASSKENAKEPHAKSSEPNSSTQTELQVSAEDNRSKRSSNSNKSSSSNRREADDGGGRAEDVTDTSAQENASTMLQSCEDAGLEEERCLQASSLSEKPLSIAANHGPVAFKTSFSWRVKVSNVAMWLSQNQEQPNPFQ
ncbi:unnamed protein product [Chrysoparadoxa australica]